MATTQLIPCSIEGVRGTLDPDALREWGDDKLATMREIRWAGTTWQNAAARYMAHVVGKDAPHETTFIEIDDKPAPFHFAQRRHLLSRDPWVYRVDDAGPGEYRITPVGKFRRARP